MDPVAFQIGPLAVHWYGLLIVTGAVLAAFVASREAQRRGLDPEHAWSLLTWCLLFGIVGARLYHVFSSPQGGFAGWEYYRENPIAIIAFWDGGFRGLGIFGGVIGGAIGLGLYCWRYKLYIPTWLDIAAPGVLLAQAIGRWGNFVNQELYGPPTTLPWGIRIDAANRFGDFRNLELYPVETTRFHPLFLYESLWNVAMFGLLLFVAYRYAHRLRPGDIFLGYMIAYPAGRVWVESLRPDAWVIGQLATAQWISIISIVAAVIVLFLRHRNWTTGSPQEPDSSASPGSDKDDAASRSTPSEQRVS